MDKFAFEFQKLDEIDLGVALWLKQNQEEALFEFLKHIVQSYRNAGISINEDKLIQEFNDDTPNQSIE